MVYYYYKYTCMFRSINRSLRPTGCMPWIIWRLGGFLFVKDAACRGNKITASWIFKEWSKIWGWWYIHHRTEQNCTQSCTSIFQVVNSLYCCLWFVSQDSEVDGAEVQEKVKEVICKTITTLPLTADTTSKEKLNSDLVSSISTCRSEKPLCLRIVGEKGALQQNSWLKAIRRRVVQSHVCHFLFCEAWHLISDETFVLW